MKRRAFRVGIGFGWRILLLAAGITAAVSLSLWAAGLAPLRGAFVGINLVTLAIYGYDKQRARLRRWRVPEVVLHVLAAAGGTLGAFVGQVLFRHKTRDRRFLAVFWAIAVVQLLLLLWLAWGGSP